MGYRETVDDIQRSVDAARHAPARFIIALLGFAVLCVAALVHMAGSAVRPLFDAYEKACRQGRADACLGLAEASLAQKGLTRRLRARKAEEYLSRACQGGSGRGCYLLGERLLTAHAGYWQAEREGIEAYKRGCALGSGEACFGFARENDVDYGVRRRQPAISAPSYQKACALAEIAEACWWAGLMMQQGQGVARDLEGGEALIRKACDGGFEKACQRLMTK